MAKTTARAKIGLIAGALALVPVLLLIFEVGTRVLRPHIDPLAVFVTSPQLRQDTQGVNTSGMFEFDPLLTWRLRPNLRDVWWDYTSVTTNSRGLRMKTDVSSKKAGVVRIVVLGDSVTFGYRVPQALEEGNGKKVEKGRPYFELLGDLLRKSHPGREFEVLPLACPGYTSGQGLAWLRRDIAELKPDIVTACFGWNNIRAAGLPDRETFPQTDGQVLARKIISRSQGLLMITGEAAAKNADAATKASVQRMPEPRTSADEYAAHFEQMAAVCKDHGAWFGVILPVYRDPNTPDTEPKQRTDPEEGRRMGEYRERLRKMAIAQALPVLEIVELTEKSWPVSRSLFGERIHPNAEGHQLMAERIAEFIDGAIKQK
jgi:lysophospholipase L1-like esterase